MPWISVLPSIRLSVHTVVGSAGGAAVVSSAQPPHSPHQPQRANHFYFMCCCLSTPREACCSADRGAPYSACISHTEFALCKVQHRSCEKFQGDCLSCVTARQMLGASNPLSKAYSKIKRKKHLQLLFKVPE